MATIESNSNLCIYCYKTVLEYNVPGISKNDKIKDNIHNRFLNVLSRHLNVPIEAYSIETETNCCNDCCGIIGAFCDLYHQIKCLELKLYWEVDKFLNVMKLADRVPSRVKTFKNTTSFDRKTEFRKGIKRKCKILLSQSLPRVLVSITRPAKVPEIEAQINLTSTTKFRENAPIGDTDIDLSSLEQCHRNNNEYFLVGWVTTLAALFFLSHLQSTENSEVEVGSDLLSLDENHEELIDTRPSLAYIIDDNSNDVCDSPVYFNTNDDFEEETINCTVQTQIAKLEETEIENQSLEILSFEEPILSTETITQRKVLESVIELKTSEIRDIVLTNTSSLQSSSTLITKDTKVEKSAKRKLSSPTFERRSLRTKHQCSNCRATFSDVSKYEKHTKTCIQSNEEELESDHDTDHDDIKFYDAKMEIESGSESSSEDDANLLKDLTKRSINSSPHSKNKPFVPDKNTCTKCTPSMRFVSLKSLQSHENYKHSNGRVHVYLCNIPKSDMESLKLDDTLVRGRYNCNIENCTKIFDVSKELENHEKLHSIFICAICDLSFEYAVNLIKHELEHSEVKQQLENENFKKGEIFACTRCEYKHQSENRVVNHYLSDHLKLPIIQSKCAICQQIFPNRERVSIQHYINYHDLNRLDTPSNRVICTEPDCSAYFLTEEQMHIHWNRQHVAGCTSKESIILIQKKDAFRRRQAESERQKHKTQSCPYCHKVFMYQSDVRAHVIKMHGNNGSSKSKRNKVDDLVISKDGITVDDIVLEQNAKYFCEVDNCKEKFRDKEDFESHSKLHGEFCCNFCENVETFAVDLALHEMVHVKVGEAENFEEKMKRRPKVYKCSRCPYKVGLRIRYLEHFVSRHLELKIDRKRCPICKYVYDHDTYNRAKSLKLLKYGVYQHFIKWHDFTVMEGGEEKCAKRCESCPALFKTKLQLLYHTEEVHNPNRLKSEDDWGNVCVDCGKDMIDRNGLLKHRRKVHKIKTNFTCEIMDCGKKFETCKELINHDTSVHRNDEVLVCTECGKKFFNNFALLSHMRSHEEKVQKKVVVKGHVCEQCGKSFRGRSQLVIHYKFHKGPESWEFECEICKKKLSSKQKLQQHMRTHTKEKPFFCQVCGVAYAHRHNLRIHTNSKHKEIQDNPKSCDTTNFASWRKGKKLK